MFPTGNCSSARPWRRCAPMRTGSCRSSPACGPSMPPRTRCSWTGSGRVPAFRAGGTTAARGTTARLPAASARARRATSTSTRRSGLPHDRPPHVPLRRLHRRPAARHPALPQPRGRSRDRQLLRRVLGRARRERAADLSRVSGVRHRPPATRKRQMDWHMRADSGWPGLALVRGDVMTRGEGIVLIVCAVVALAALVFLAVRLWPRRGQHEAPRGWRPADDERMASTDTRERYDWTAADMPFLPAEGPARPTSSAGPPWRPARPPRVMTDAELAPFFRRTPMPEPSEHDWTGPHAVPDIPGAYSTGCTICGDKDHAAEGHDAIVSIWSPPSFRDTPPDGLPAYARKALHDHDTVDETMDSVIMAAYRDPGDGEEPEAEDSENGEDPMKITITRVHLAVHQDATIGSCNLRRRRRPEELTMDPGLVTCGNCKRTTLYQTAVRVTEQIAVLDEHLALGQ